MSDKTIPADKVRKIASEMRAAMRRDDSTYHEGEFLSDMSDYVRDLDKLCARARPLPTLADMPDEERAACQWMQCDVETWGRAVIVLPNERGGRTVTLNRRGHMAYEDHTDVTPRPDLPRLEWPEATPTGPDHLAVGTVIESAADPRIAALPDGSILLDRDDDSVTKRDGAWSGDGYVPNEPEGKEFGPWTVLHIPKEADQ